MPTAHDNALPTVSVLGLGSMGSSIALRLRDQGHSITVWNRSRAKADAVATYDGVGQARVALTPAEAISSCAPNAIIILIVTDIKTTKNILFSEGVGDALQGRTLVNLASGNPDEGRDVAAVVAEVSRGKAAYIDGAYSGNPSKARAGQGQLFLSSEKRETVERASVMTGLAEVTYCGGIGASRAFDYAVVDLFFANTLSFMSNAAALQNEEVEMQPLFKAIAARLATVPAVLELYSERMKSRSEQDYIKDTTCTLNAARSYWASRLPYNKVHGIPSHLTNLFVDLLDDASGGREGEHSAADLSRLQEVVRYGREPPFSSTHPWIVLVLGAVVGATAASAFWYQRARAR